VYVEPVIEDGGYKFTVNVGKPKDAETAKNGTKLSRGANFRCLMSGTPIASDYIKAEGKAGRMGVRLMAIAAEGERERVYLRPSEAMEAVARQAESAWKPDVVISGSTQYLGVKPYGMEQYSQLFTDRQLVALSTFSNLVHDVLDHVKRDALAAGLHDEGKALASGGIGTNAYGDAVVAILALAVDKAADYWSTVCFWHNGAAHQKIVNTFSRQAIAMSWDFAEGNPFSRSSGHFLRFVSLIAEVLDFAVPARPPGRAEQEEATQLLSGSSSVISTDPPYFDNVPYADLSDFFYVWLRHTLGADQPPAREYRTS
jgi:putative DNA methylase